MEKFSRSKSNKEGAMQKPSSMHDLRSYSTPDYNFKANKGSKNRNINGGLSSSRSWSFSVDPELQRKKRVAGYKAYGMEGKMKGSLRKSFKWIKDACNQVVHGFR
ncbi:hypothetical protein F511_12007 [Dorcoceras hygrometricum]|uniref:Uncharacterized protein n=1 Tax=Dorcoceras hygrometricum TaxID=472368 RepID=A0A2Z7AB48_9LAMI|nr:hypothetical protein F511_12007 [Dorcoceras hygrometricum]